MNTIRLNNVVTLLQSVLVLVSGYYLFKLVSDNRVTELGSKTGGFLGDVIGDIINPDIVRATIKVKSNYFVNGVLRPDVAKVFRDGYPNMYRQIFNNDRLKPEFMYLLDNDRRYADVDFVL